jgi:hypothetical protein
VIKRRHFLAAPRVHADAGFELECHQMKKIVLGVLGALALGVTAIPAVAAPSLDAPIQAALYQVDAGAATVQTVQYRPYGYRAPPPRRFYRPHRRFVRPPHRFNHYPRGLYRGPGPRPGFGRY